MRRRRDDEQSEKSPKRDAEHGADRSLRPNAAHGFLPICGWNMTSPSVDAAPLSSGCGGLL